MNILPLDPHDTAFFDAWYDAYLAAEMHDREWYTPWTKREMLVALTYPSKSLGRVVVAARDGDTVLGGVMVELPLLDNRTHAYIELFIHPDAWGTDAAHQLLHAAEQAARDHGRTTLMAWLSYPLDGAPTDDPHVAFMLANGYAEELTEYQRAIDLPVEVPEVVVADGYRLVTFEGLPPEEFKLGVRALESSFNVEAPSSTEFEVGYLDDEVDAQREARRVAQGRTVLSTLAVSHQGEVGGFTELVLPAEDTWAFQEATLVSRPHRGHGLGLALKRQNLAELQRRFPERTSIRTWNAGDNQWMVAINDSLGFRPVEAMAELLKMLP